MQVTVEICSGRQAGRRTTLQAGQAVQVGRLEPAHLAVHDDSRMSNLHFALEYDGETCRLRDLNSRFGTLVNNQPVTEATLHNGDRIFAGGTAFLIHIGDAEAPAAGTKHGDPIVSGPSGLPAVENLVTSGTALHERVLQVLRQQPEPLFALLDAARDPLVLARVLSCQEEYQSLYEGPKGEQLAASAPYLVSLPRQSSFLAGLVREGWGKSWGVYLTCKASFKEVRKHFRHFLLVKTEEGKELYFRFYDPRVLRIFLPTCTPQEAAAFFGPIQCFLLEDEGPGVMSRFTQGDQGAGRTAVPLSLSKSASG